MPLTFEQRQQLKQRWFPAADKPYNIMHDVLERYVQPGGVVLDAGSSAGTWILRRHFERMNLLVGADLAIPEPPTAQASDMERQIAPVLADLSHTPFTDAAFDLILCYNVLEHLAEPERTFGEFHRLLKPGGAVLIKAPALHSPTMLAAHLVPHTLHERFKGRLGVDEEDVFPTLYRCNTPQALDKALSAAGLQQKLLFTLDQTYDYLYFSRLSFTLGLLYSRTTQLPGLRRLQNAIIAVYVRPK